MATEYILEVYYPDDSRSYNGYKSSKPFGAFSVGDTVQTDAQEVASITRIGHMISQLPESDIITHITMLYTSTCR